MGQGPLLRSLCHHRALPLPCVTSPGLSLQLRQGPVALEPKEQAEPKTPEAQSGRLIEVERSVSGGWWWARGLRRAVAWPLTPLCAEQNAMLVAEKTALQGQLQLLEGQLGSLQGRAQELLLQSQQAQECSSRLQVGGGWLTVPHPIPAHLPLSLPLWYCFLPLSPASAPRQLPSRPLPTSASPSTCLQAPVCAHVSWSPAPFSTASQ